MEGNYNTILYGMQRISHDYQLKVNTDQKYQDASKAAETQAKQFSPAERKLILKMIRAARKDSENPQNVKGSPKEDAPEVVALAKRMVEIQGGAKRADRSDSKFAKIARSLKNRLRRTSSGELLKQAAKLPTIVTSQGSGSHSMPLAPPARPAGAPPPKPNYDNPLSSSDSEDKEEVGEVDIPFMGQPPDDLPPVFVEKDETQLRAEDEAAFKNLGDAMFGFSDNIKGRETNPFFDTKPIFKDFAEKFVIAYEINPRDPGLINCARFFNFKIREVFPGGEDQFYVDLRKDFKNTNAIDFLKNHP